METVTVKALQWHTHNGIPHDIGDEYEIAADLVDSVMAQGMAAPVTKPVQAPPAKPKSK